MNVEVDWGIVTVFEGENTICYKDAMIYPKGHCNWDWRKSDTHHNPGIQISDIQFLVSKGAKVIIISAGMCSRLLLSQETKDWMVNNDLEFYYLETPEAVRKFNQLCSERNDVGCLIHSTC